MGKSHVHNEWVPESLLLRIAKRKCINFKRRHEEPCDRMDRAWTVPERFLARRCSPSGPGWEVLVKWTNLGHENSTWEVCAVPHAPSCRSCALVALETLLLVLLLQRWPHWCGWLRQVEGEGLMAKPEYLRLHRELWERQQEALRKSSPAAVDAEEAAFEAARRGLPELGQEQPAWVKGCKLYPHQLQVISAL